jgi:hypothetical protein
LIIINGEETLIFVDPPEIETRDVEEAVIKGEEREEISSFG